MPSSDASTFNVKAYKRLEKWNNYLNVVSVVLIFLALSTIPVTFFSLRASRSGESSTLVSTTKLEAFNTAGSVFTPVRRNDLGLPDYVTQYSETIEVFIAFQNANNTVGIASSVPPPDALRFLLPTNLLGVLRWNVTVGTFEYWKSLRRRVEEGKTEAHNGTNPCMRGKKSAFYFDASLNELIYCVAVRSFEDQSFLIRMAPTDPHWILRTNFVSTYYYHQPKVDLNTAAFCESAICIPITDVRLEKKKDQDVTTSYLNTNLMSNNPFPAGPGIALVSTVIFFATDGIRNTPSTLRTTFFEEVDKYSVSDTAIDSFAISGIIVSSILLFVTLAKMVLFFVFNPNRKFL